MKKTIFFLLIAVTLASNCFSFVNRNWNPKEYVILDNNPNDEYNGIHTNMAVRPIDSKKFNERGCGIVTLYGGNNFRKWVNVSHKNTKRSYDPFDLHKIKVLNPKRPPLWFVKEKYHWFYDKNGNKKSNWAYWENEEKQ